MVAMLMPAMRNILLCSSDPLLVKSLTNVLRDEGFIVVTVEHPALAIQRVMGGRYGMMIVDSEPFGLSAEDAVRIIRSLMPDFPVLYVGSAEHGPLPAVETPIDLEKFKRTVHSIAIQDGSMPEGPGIFAAK